jgi:hypothetical protein
MRSQTSLVPCRHNAEVREVRGYTQSSGSEHSLGSLGGTGEAGVAGGGTENRKNSTWSLVCPSSVKQHKEQVTKISEISSFHSKKDTVQDSQTTMTKSEKSCFFLLVFGGRRVASQQPTQVSTLHPGHTGAGWTLCWLPQQLTTASSFCKQGW